MTVDGIVAGVRTLLATPEGLKKAQTVVGYLADLHSAETLLKRKLKRIGRRPGCKFFATVGSLRQERLLLDARIHGRSVGDVRLDLTGARTFTAKEAFRALTEKWPENIEWGDARVAKYLRDVASEVEGHVTEAMVQSTLFEDMAEGVSTDKQGLLLNHQPVTMLRLPFQFPLPIKASGGDVRLAKGSAVGHADIVARTGGGRATRVRVFELKRPRSSDAATALAQAVAYTAALEALLALDRPSTLWALGLGASRKLVRFEAAAFVNHRAKDLVLREAERLQQGNRHYALHAFFYEQNGTSTVVKDALLVGRPH